MMCFSLTILNAIVCALFAVLTVDVPFPFSGQCRMWKSIESGPDHSLFLYFEYYDEPCDLVLSRIL